MFCEELTGLPFIRPHRESLTSAAVYVVTEGTIDTIYLGCNSVRDVTGSLMFRMVVLPPSSGSKSRPSQVGFSPELLFDPTDRGSTILRNVGRLLPDYKVSQPGRW
jgi:hypothetical protein